MKRRKFMILKVTNDEYEFVLDIYDSPKDMMQKCNIKSSTVYGKFHQPTKAVKWVKVYLDD